MNGNFQNDSGESKKIRQSIENAEDHYVCRSRYMFSGCIGVVILAIAATLWIVYLSPDARQSRELQQEYQQFINQQDIYTNALRQDTYGGSSPQETLSLFIEALESDDLELASKYFVITESGAQDPQILTSLQEIKDKEEVVELIKTLQAAQYDKDSSYESSAFFRSNGHIITLVLNEETGVWKIENL